MSRSSMGGIGLLLALVLGACSGSAQAKGDLVDTEHPRGTSEDRGAAFASVDDPWEMGYCISEENDVVREHESDGEYGTGSYVDMLASRPCTLDLAFGYGKLLAKHNLSGDQDYAKIWKTLSDREPEFRDNVMRFADGYAENFVNR